MRSLGRVMSPSPRCELDHGSTPPEYLDFAYCTPRPKLSHSVFATLLGEVSIHACARNPPVATVQLVGALEGAVLAPTPDRRRGAAKPFHQFGYREIRSRIGLLGLAFVGRG